MSKPNLIKGNANNNWYVSDGIHKRLLLPEGSQTVQEQVDELVGSGTINAGVYNQPWVLDQDTVNAIRTV